MLTTIGIFIMLIGFVLLMGGLGRVLFMRSSASGSWKYAAGLGGGGSLLILISLIMLQFGEGQGVGRVPIGAALIFAGLFVMAIGIYYSVWAPVAIRNFMGGWKLILVGAVVVILGILAMTMTSGALSDPGTIVSGSGVRLPDLQRVFSRRMGPIPFGAFVFGVLLAGNGMGIKNKLTWQALLGANIFLIAMLVFFYFLGPELFRTW